LLWTGFGFAVLMVMGVSVCALHPLASHASIKPSYLNTEVANFAFVRQVDKLGRVHEQSMAKKVSPAVPIYRTSNTNTPSRANVVMGANIREMRDRIGSVQNTQKITSAMKLVAAAKVRRAQDAVLRGRPFSDTLDQVVAGLVKRLKIDSMDIPLMEERKVKKVGLVVFTGDRGLCGGYNSNAIKKAQARIDELKAQGIEVELVTIGQKAISWFKKRDTPVRMTAMCGQSPTAEQAQGISDDLLNAFFAGELDRIELVYTKFISMIASAPSIRTLVPLSPSGIEMEGDEVYKFDLKVSKDGDGLGVEKVKAGTVEPREWVPDMIFEQEPTTVVNAILPLYLSGQMLKSFQESVASELAARMAAMGAASDNAKELKGKLMQEMNRARQAKVTQELMEIVAGANV